MGFLGIIGGAIAGKIGVKIWDTTEQAIEDWQTGRRQRLQGQLSLSVRAGGRQATVPVQDGVMQAAQYMATPAPGWEPIYLGGAFYADPSFIDFAEDILDHDEKVVLLFVQDEYSGDVVVGSFDFIGYSIALPPGSYSMYAFIVDPILDELLALGYPRQRHLQDPNPIDLIGPGPLRLDFVLFETEPEWDDEDWEDWDEDEDDWEDDWTIE